MVLFRVETFREATISAAGNQHFRNNNPLKGVGDKSVSFLIVTDTFFLLYAYNRWLIYVCEAGIKCSRQLCFRFKNTDYFYCNCFSQERMSLFIKVHTIYCAWLNDFSRIQKE